MGGPQHSPATCEVEYGLWHNHGIRVIKKTLAQLKRDATLDEHGKLMLGAFEASHFFFFERFDQIKVWAFYGWKATFVS